jgi:hypothetical protein
MRVRCPKCGLFIPGNDIELSARAALCRPCGEVLLLPNGDRLRAKLYKPDDLRWKEVRSATGVVITVSGAWWRTLGHGLGLALFAAAFDTILALLVSSWITHPAMEWLISWVFFVAAFLAGGVFFTYRTLAVLLNRTRITLHRDHLRIVRTPIRERDDLQEATAEVEDFAVGEDGRTGPLKSRGVHASNAEYCFKVRVHTRDGTSHKTHLAFRDRMHAEYAADRLAQLVDDIRSTRDDATPYRGARGAADAEESVAPAQRA